MNIVNVGYDSTNYYLIADSRPRLLVDAGWPGTLGRFQHACRRAGVDLAAVGHLFVTHFHPDHAGLAHELIRGGAKLIVAESQFDFVAPFRRYFKPEHGDVDIELSRCVQTDFDASRAVLAGIGIHGQLVPTPGHSDDSVTLLLDDGSAFTGDLPHPLMADETARASWDKLRYMGAKIIFPGHGPAGPLPAF